MAKAQAKVKRRESTETARETEQDKLLAALEMERRLVDALERANSELRRNDRLKDEFISNVSHELRTSLASVKNVISNGLAGVFGSLPDPFRRSLIIADDNIRRFGYIINDLLDVARMGAGKMALSRAMLDPVQVVMDTVSSFEEEASRRGVKLYGKWEAPQFFAFMDRDRIAQVIGNLLSNALKFTPKGGSIVVRGTIVDDRRREISTESLKSPQEGSSIAIEVSDTGPGIDPKRWNSIFDRFEQAGAASQGNSRGLGLGLSICKQLVTLHGGEIWVGSSKAGGAQFTFTIPFLGMEKRFREALSDRLRTAVMHHDPISIALIEISYAEEPGRSGGIPENTARQAEAIILKTLRRKGDMAMWRGGGRFGVILPQTSSDEAKSVAKRIERAFAESEWRSGEALAELKHMSSVSGFPEDLDSVDPLIAAAEERLKRQWQKRSSS